MKTLAFWTLSICLFSNTYISAADPVSKPNIIFILADDLGINDLGCYGRKEHHTPHLDQLAKDGMLFRSAYAACPVCSPTRAAILTGKHPARLHITTFLPGRADAKSQKLLHPKINQQLALEEKTLAEHLKSIGYATAAIGKWHLGNAGFTPDKQGFDVVYPGKGNSLPSDNEGGKSEYDLTNKATAFITANQEKPFFLYLPHHTPHIPLAAKKSLVDKYKNTYNPIYAAMIHEMDESVGKILTKLDELKLSQKTIVIFTSDNGGLHVPELKDDPPTHNTPYRAGKGFLYEGGIRVPLIVRWPGIIPAGSVNQSPVISTDWTPTFLDACGIKADEKLDGTSLVPILKGEKTPERTLYWHIPHYTNQGSRPCGAIRRGDHKLIVNYEDNSEELYNTKTDLAETNNQANLQVNLVKTLRQDFDAWLEKVGAQKNTINPDFDQALHKLIYQDTDVSKLIPKATAVETTALYREWRKLVDAAVRKN